MKTIGAITAKLYKCEGYWPHDSVAIANYFCRGCFNVTSKINQA